MRRGLEATVSGKKQTNQGRNVPGRSSFKRDGDVPQSTKDKLDEFIEATFPASDPFCLTNPVDRVGTPE
jgi:hypothetical protein